MSIQAPKRRARFVGAALILSLASATAFAEPPRYDSPKMRNAPRASATLPTSSQPATTAAPSAAAPAQPAAADAATVARSTKEATEVLELCYELARRSDTTLKAPVSLHATVRPDGRVELRAHEQSLGNGFFSRCVERKLSVIVTVPTPPEASASTRTIVLGAAPVAIVR